MGVFNKILFISITIQTPKDMIVLTELKSKSGGILISPIYTSSEGRMLFVIL